MAKSETVETLANEHVPDNLVELLMVRIQQQDDKIEEMERLQRQGPRLPIYQKPEEKLKGANQQAQSRKIAFGPMPRPVYGDGDIVKLRHGSPTYALYERAHKEGRLPVPVSELVGAVYDVPKKPGSQHEWKHRVRFPGVGKDAIPECDLVLADSY